MITTPAPLSPYEPLDDVEVTRLGEGGIVVRSGFLGDVLGLSARQHLLARYQQGDLAEAGIGRRGRTTSIRQDLITWVEPGDPAPMGEVWRGFDALRVALSGDLRRGLERFSVQGACYADGATYKPHFDAFKGDPSRIVTAIWYVNPGWDASWGGTLRAWTPDGAIEVIPTLGTLVLFLSEKVRHEVLAAHRPRFALTAWYRGAEPLPLLPDPEAIAR